MRPSYRKFLLTLLLFQGFAQVWASDYIVTLKNPKAKEGLSKKLEKLPPNKMLVLGPGVYLIKYDLDPGLKKLSDLLGKDASVQPNLPYKSHK